MAKPAAGKPKNEARAAPVLKREVLGFLDRIDDAGVGGWAVDLADPLPGLGMRIVIDEMVVDVIRCDLQREDTAALKLPTRRIGFYYNIPERYHDGMRHVLKFATVDGAPIAMSSRTGNVMTALNFCLSKPQRVEGKIDGIAGGLIIGWALNIDDRAQTKLGGVRVLVTLADQPVAELLADEYRADAAEAMGCDAACGFVFAPPPELCLTMRTQFRFFALPGYEELQNSPAEFNTEMAGAGERVQALMRRTDELFTLAFHLRRELQAALPRERFFLSDYARWAKKSLPLALPRAVARYRELPPQALLVSVVCPVYRPNIGHFMASVDAVRRQSYTHWELLLVDDGSMDGALSLLLRQLAAADARIKVSEHKNNLGIAAATNTALQQAAGAFIAFLDHDDVIEPAALEIMLRAQASTGAALLYSDEDKIDGAGALSEPHLKPDFNYRFLLEVNYICHFVLVDAGLVRQIGALNAQFDGAQDHDFLLRACELLPAAKIHHVPEILYHWRKSGGSTAAAGTGAKPKAVAAGEAAVATHLLRRGLAAEVKSRSGLTCYQVNWRVPRALKQAARVSILIPFRDHIDMTAACVAAIREHTTDVDYEIILLDNGSASAQAEAFTAAQANLPATRVIRIVEKFNYSRINNIGAKAARHGYLLCLNNDVFVSEPNWLRCMLDECLINDRVGAVGAKLLYPCGRVQHAGVALGVGGVAEHAFRGVAGSAPGYAMRAMAAQEISAITGACMLVRKVAFEAVGGFDAAELTVAFNDVDLCVKLILAGWQIVYAPNAVAEHRESASRGDDFNESKIARFMLENEVMRQRYAEVLPYDPFYNRHFSREGGIYKELRLLGPEDF